MGTYIDRANTLPDSAGKSDFYNLIDNARPIAIADDDLDTKIQVEESADEDIIRFDTAGAEQIRLSDGVLRPSLDNDIDLGASGAEFKDLYIDGTANIDTLNADVFKLGTTNQGDIFYDNGTSIVRLTPGTSGQFLQTQGAGANPQWASLATSLQAAFDGGQSITVADTDNQTFTYTNNDTTNNPIMATFTNAGTNHGLEILQTGALAASRYSLKIESSANNTGNLVYIVNDNASTTGNNLYMASASANNLLVLQSGGNGAHIKFAGDPTVASPSDGQMWFDGTNLKMRIGSTTYNINMTAE
ncbi:MAG: hypothetical protein ACTSUF_10310 [Candidatus Heimdallarchaeaceae archaeon]